MASLVSFSILIQYFKPHSYLVARQYLKITDLLPSMFYNWLSCNNYRRVLASKWKRIYSHLTECFLYNMRVVIYFNDACFPCRGWSNVWESITLHVTVYGVSRLFYFTLIAAQPWSTLATGGSSLLHFNMSLLLYSRISISRTRISRILRNSKRLSETKKPFWLLSPTILWCWILFYMSKLPEVQINLHFG